MGYLIDKDALVAEINRRYKLVDKYETNEFCAVASRDELVHLMNFINTIEVKEVDFQIYVGEELENFLSKHKVYDDLDIAKHFFELGKKNAEEQMMKDATEVTVHIEAGGYPYIPQMELYDYDKDIPLAKEGDKYKVVLIKEE